jgi:hypothetical protein
MTQNLNELLKGQLSIAEQATNAFKPQWETRKDVARTLVTLSSAALAITLAFKSSLLQTTIHPLWRYCIITCWLALTASLYCSLLTLWYSIGLFNHQVLIMSMTKKIEATVKETLSKTPLNLDPFTTLMLEPLQVIGRRDKITRRLSKAAIVCYSVALGLVVVMGIRQISL